MKNLTEAKAKIGALEQALQKEVEARLEAEKKLLGAVDRGIKLEDALFKAHEWIRLLKKDRNGLTTALRSIVMGDAVHAGRADEKPLPGADLIAHLSSLLMGKS